MTAGAIVRALVVMPLAVVITALGGCGGGSGRGEKDRPPLPLTIAVQIGDNEVTSSPSVFGAGPVTLIASNQTRVPQKLKIDGPRLTRVLPVDPADTATLKATLQPGEYALTTDTSQQVPPFRLKVGAERGSTQDRLLLP